MEIKNITSPEAILMLTIAAGLDLCSLAIVITGIWVDMGTTSTFFYWFCLCIFGSWVYIRGGMSLKDLVKSHVKMFEKVGKEGAKDKPAGDTKYAGKATNEGEMQGGTPKDLKKTDKKESQGQAKPQKKDAQNLGGKVVDKGKALVKRVGWSIIVKAFPIIGAIWPGLTIFVWRELNRG